VIRETAQAILVVDDDEQDRRLIATVLNDEGHRASTANDAAEARVLLETQQFALAVCDLQLPGEPGVSLIEHMQAEHPETPVLVVSGDGDRLTAETLLRLGAYGYLIKPFGLDQFMIGVANALRRRALEQARVIYEESLEETVQIRTAELRASREETVRRLTAALEYRDSDTGLHSQRTSRYSSLIATGIGLDARTRELITLAAPLHDIGKIAIPDTILYKAGPFSEDEHRIMQTHTRIGHQILAGSGEELLELAATIALTHHERLDGSGYPNALCGTAIPQAGRIAAVADVFEALTSDRPYRRAYPFDKAVNILVSLRGGELDADLVDALLNGLHAHPDGGTASSTREVSS
jgi:putative two-component system response regulator